MDAENTEKPENQVETESEPTPLCLNCMRPMPAQAYFCPHCGEAVGRLSTYLPYVNTPWIMRTWDHMWRQMWSRNVSVPGRLFRLLVILVCMPILLMVSLPVILWDRREKVEQQSVSDLDDHDEPPSAD